MVSLFYMSNSPVFTLNKSPMLTLEKCYEFIVPLVDGSMVVHPKYLPNALFFVGTPMKLLRL